MATNGTKLARSAGYFAPAIFDSATYQTPALIQTGGHYRFRQSLFVAADLACILGAAFLAIAMRFPGPAAIRSHPRLLVPEHIGITLLYSGLIILFCHTQNLYSAYQPTSWTKDFIAIVKSILFASALLSCTLFLSGVKSTSRLIVASTAVGSTIAMTSWRQIRRRSLKKAVADGLSCHNVLIVGTDHLAHAVAEHLAQHRQFGFVVLGHLQANNSIKSPGTRNASDEASTHPSLNILGTVDQLKTLCRTHFIDEILVCAHDRGTVMQVISDARESGIGVRVIPDLYDGLAWGARMDYLGDFPSLAVVNRTTPAFAMTLKRILDVLISATALVFLSPFLLLLAIIVKLDSRGPALYASKRVGKKGRVFSCLKFRTMVPNADALKAHLEHLNEREGILFKITNDPRITRAGQFMRKHSLDELPQLWNVFRGEMSLVGPRPPLASEVKNYQLDYLRRLDVAPGITGLWQVEARNDPSFDQYISLDLNYVENWSLSLDFNILLRTVAVVLSGTGS